MGGIGIGTDDDDDVDDDDDSGDDVKSMIELGAGGTIDR
jgi:hypothetical protein